MTYNKEIGELAAELQADEPTLTEAEARAVAEEIITPLYEYALAWNNDAFAMCSMCLKVA